MTPDDFQKKLEAITKDADDIYTSPDFQCDQTGGFPTSLCVCWEKGKAWLAPNDFMITDLPDGQAKDILDACAEVRYPKL